jgi:hypothetical protein
MGTTAGVPAKAAWGGFTSSGLKLLAIASMLADHIGAILPVPPPYVYALRCAGRLAFPIFAFVLVEGCRHTRSLRAYALRLALFALVSEIPFNLLYSYHVFDPEGQNIFFTLLIGLLTIFAADSIDKRMGAAGAQSWLGLLKLAAMCAGALAAEAMRADYGAFGIVIILVLHAYRDNRAGALARAAFVCVFVGAASWMLSAQADGLSAAEALPSAVEALAALAAVPLYFYNGKKGAPMKYFFYAFYPLHISALALAKAIIFHAPLPLVKGAG